MPALGRIRQEDGLWVADHPLLHSGSCVKSHTSMMGREERCLPSSLKTRVQTQNPEGERKEASCKSLPVLMCAPHSRVHCTPVCTALPTNRKQSIKRARPGLESKSLLASRLREKKDLEIQKKRTNCLETGAGKGGMAQRVRTVTTQM